MHLLKLTVFFYCYCYQMVVLTATSSINPTVTRSPTTSTATTDTTSNSTPGSLSTASTSTSSKSPPSTAPISVSSTLTTSTSSSSTSTTPTSGSSTLTTPASGTSTLTTTSSSSTSTTPTSASSTSTTPTSGSSTLTTPASGTSTLTTTSSSSTSTTPTSASSTSTTPTSASSTSTTPTSASSPLTTPVAPISLVKISETNILIDSGNPRFLELEGPKNKTVTNVKLSIQSASLPLDTASAKLLEDTFDAGGYLVISNVSDFTPDKQIPKWTSVLIVLYENSSNNILDSLLYSTQSNRNINKAVLENCKIQYDLIFDPISLANVNKSFSRCSLTGSSDAFVLTSTTQNKSNACNLTLSKELKMRMTSNSIMTPCKNELPNNFNTILERQIITSINEKQSCGLSSFMIKGFRENWECLDNKTAEITINITIASIFEEQLSQVEKGYKKFLSDKNFKVNEKVWSVEECLGNCVPSIKPPINDDDDKIRVTVAVVVSCIGVFLIVLIAVVVYMKNKRHRILQFHMTRLDDDEDDLIGDMDDFVGNQGPTFRTFR